MFRHRAVIVLAIGCSLPLGVQADDAPVRARRVRLTYSAEVRDIPADAREATLWVPFPPSNDSQAVSNVVVRSDVAASVSREDEYGNQALSLNVRDPGSKPIRIELQFDVLRRERRNSAAVARKQVEPPPDKEKISERWLQRDRLVPIDGKVLELARTVTR
jgi:hypothetical protein